MFQRSVGASILRASAFLPQLLACSCGAEECGDENSHGCSYGLRHQLLARILPYHTAGAWATAIPRRAFSFSLTSDGEHVVRQGAWTRRNGAAQPIHPITAPGAADAWSHGLAGLLRLAMGLLRIRHADLLPKSESTADPELVEPEKFWVIFG